jgi:hypothetical protein
MTKKTTHNAALVRSPPAIGPVLVRVFSVANGDEPLSGAFRDDALLDRDHENLAAVETVLLSGREGHDRVNHRSVEWRVKWRIKEH